MWNVICYFFLATTTLTFPFRVRAFVRARVRARARVHKRDTDVAHVRSRVCASTWVTAMRPVWHWTNKVCKPPLCQYARVHVRHELRVRACVRACVRVRVCACVRDGGPTATLSAMGRRSSRAYMGRHAIKGDGDLLRCALFVCGPGI